MTPTIKDIFGFSLLRFLPLASRINLTASIRNLDERIFTINNSIVTHKASYKLSKRNYGPYPIIARIGEVAYKL